MDIPSMVLGGATEKEVGEENKKPDSSSADDVCGSEGNTHPPEGFPYDDDVPNQPSDPEPLSTSHGPSFEEQKGEPADNRVVESMQGSIEEDEERNGPTDTRAAYKDMFFYVVYISSAAVVGASLRVYMARLCGEDCEKGDEAVQDFFTPFFSKICITAGGRTIQTGGALFRDFPANLLGSFLMGIITPNKHSSPFPWFRKDHPIQQNLFLHTSFGVGLCGCLTTFSSWNTQMVIMLDGTHTVLGPQIAPALFGYLLGIIGCITSFRGGRQASSWLYTRVNKEKLDGDLSVDSQQGSSEFTSNRGPYCCPDTGKGKRICRPEWTLHCVAVILIGLFILGDHRYDLLFYKNLIAATLIAPLGALTRWKLSGWNGATGHRCLPWLPWGTLAANILATIISIICQGLLDRYSGIGLLEMEWAKAILYAIKVGYAGSLSTVSSLVKELVIIKEKDPGHSKSFIYGACTLVGGMTVGLSIYMMIVRIGV